MQKAGQTGPVISTVLPLAVPTLLLTEAQTAGMHVLKRGEGSSCVRLAGRAPSSTAPSRSNPPPC